MDKLEYAERVKELAERLNSYVNEDTIKKLLKLYLLAEEDEGYEIEEDIEALLNANLPRLIFSKKPMLASPKKEEIDGEIKVGKVIQGNKELCNFGLSREELNQHVLITARSGGGKTTLIIQLIRQLISAKIPFLVFDFKRDYRHLIRHCPELVVLSWKDLRINPLDPPPKVSFDEWKQQLLNIFGHVEAIWHGSTQYLLEAIEKVREERKDSATLEDVYRKIVETNETTRKMQEY
ncbi:MAG: helicase HerA domain-containing protein, partial [Nitrososphaerales archaeon]